MDFDLNLMRVFLTVMRAQRDPRGRAAASDATRRQLRAGAAARSSTIRCSCAPPPACSPRPSPSRWPGRSARAWTPRRRAQPAAPLRSRDQRAALHAVHVGHRRNGVPAAADGTGARAGAAPADRGGRGADEALPQALRTAASTWPSATWPDWAVIPGMPCCSASTMSAWRARHAGAVARPDARPVRGWTTSWWLRAPAPTGCWTTCWPKSDCCASPI